MSGHMAQISQMAHPGQKTHMRIRVPMNLWTQIIHDLYGPKAEPKTLRPGQVMLDVADKIHSHADMEES